MRASGRGLGCGDTLRIAAVLELIDIPGAAEISKGAFERAVTLASHYASEALRFSEQGTSSIEILRAEKVRHWLHDKQEMPTVELAHICQHGPNSVGEAALAHEAMAILRAWYQQMPISTELLDRPEWLLSASRCVKLPIFQRS